MNEYDRVILSDSVCCSDRSDNGYFCLILLIEMADKKKKHVNMIDFVIESKILAL